MHGFLVLRRTQYRLEAVLTGTQNPLNNLDIWSPKEQAYKKSMLKLLSILTRFSKLTYIIIYKKWTLSWQP